MVRFNGFLIAALVGGALPALPAAAQSGNGASSLTHVVSVTIAPRVKVQISALPMSRGNVPAAVKFTATQSATNGLALRVHANRAWVLAIRSGSDSLLASGSGSAAPIDTTVVFRDGAKGTSDPAVVLTVSAP